LGRRSAWGVGGFPWRERGKGNGGRGDEVGVGEGAEEVVFSEEIGASKIGFVVFIWKTPVFSGFEFAGSPGPGEFGFPDLGLHVARVVEIEIFEAHAAGIESIRDGVAAGDGVFQV